MMPFDALRLRGASGGAPSDPYFASVVSLTHADGIDSSTTLVDQIPARTWTSNSSASLATAQKIFGTASAAFTGGGTPSNFSCPDHADWEFGSGDFTLEGGVYFTTVSGVQTVVAKTPTGGTATSPFIVINVAGTLYFAASSNGTTWDIVNVVSFGSISANTWYRWSVSRVGNDFHQHLDGTFITTTNASGTLINNSEPVFLGGRDGVIQPLSGYIDEFRATKGVGRYTNANYTLPGAAFPDS